MKNMFLVFALMISASAFSSTRIEFDESFEAKCYEEVKAIKCTDSEGEQVKQCVDKNINKLSQACRSLHKAKNS